MDDLTPDERADMERIDGPEQVLDDLYRREQECSGTAAQNLVAAIRPGLEAVREFSTLFLAMMQPLTLDTAIIWGALYLVIKVYLLPCISVDAELSRCFLSQMTAQNYSTKCWIDFVRNCPC
jgi:hypothetical protein